jgi:hypothetical protein
MLFNMVVVTDTTTTPTKGYYRLHHGLFYKVFAALSILGALATFILEIVDFGKARNYPNQYGTGIPLAFIYLCAAGLAIALFLRKLRCLAINLLVCCAVTVTLLVAVVSVILAHEMAATYRMLHHPDRGQIAIVAIKMIFACLMFCLNVVALGVVSHDSCFCCHNRVHRGSMAPHDRYGYSAVTGTSGPSGVIVQERVAGDWANNGHGNVYTEMPKA